jgi:hypothetical protein
MQWDDAYIAGYVEEQLVCETVQEFFTWMLAYLYFLISASDLLCHSLPYLTC